MIIGFWHRKNQFSVEAEALFSQNQIGATINLFLIDLIDGRVTEEEKQQMRSYLLKIMRRKDSYATISTGENKKEANSNSAFPNEKSS